MAGYLNLAPCYPEIGPPLAVSFPQSLHAPPTPLLWGHTPAPDPALHQTFMDINMDIGAPLAAQAGAFTVHTSPLQCFPCSIAKKNQ
jgi:hypothetical protein